LIALGPSLDVKSVVNCFRINDLEFMEAIVRYRDRNGDIKSIEELKKVSSVEATKIEGKKDLLVF